MPTVYAIHAPQADRLPEVIEDMRRMGVPTIRVVDCGDYLMALEGSHRLAAAAALDITPDFVIHEQGEIINIAEFDWYDLGVFSSTEYAAGEVAGDLFSPHQATVYKF